MPLAAQWEEIPLYWGEIQNPVGTSGSGVSGQCTLWNGTFSITGDTGCTYSGTGASFSLNASLFTGPVTALKSATTSVDVSAATAPTAGKSLVASSSIAASWVT